MANNAPYDQSLYDKFLSDILNERNRLTLTADQNFVDSDGLDNYQLLQKLANGANDLARSPEYRAAVAAAFGNQSNTLQAVNNASSSPTDNVCFSATDDCPKFRIIIENNLSCKDIKIKNIRITCTDSDEVLLGLRPSWLLDPEASPPEVQSTVLGLADLEFAAQAASFDIKIFSSDANGVLSEGKRMEGNCTVYNTDGSFSKKFEVISGVCSGSLSPGIRAGVDNGMIPLQRAIDDLATQVSSAVDKELQTSKDQEIAVIGTSVFSDVNIKVL